MLRSDGVAARIGEQCGSATLPDIAPEVRSAMLRHLLISRAVDDEAIRLQNQGRLNLWLSCRGQEAAQVGSMTAFGDAAVFPSYREHAAAVVRGIDPASILAQWGGRTFCGWDPVRHRFFPYTLVVAAQALHAVGYAIGRRVSGHSETVVVYFGDGATSQGDISEAMNLAAVEAVPVLFVCQNNGWAISKPSHEQMRGSIAARAEGFGLRSWSVDAHDPDVTYLRCLEAQTLRRRDARARSDRTAGHPGEGTQQLGRPYALPRRRRTRRRGGQRPGPSLSGHPPRRRRRRRGLGALGRGRGRAGRRSAGGGIRSMTREACLAESLNHTLHRLMSDDESVVLLGQDIGRLGGVFRVTRDLQSQFGRDRVRDAVLAESSIVGQAIGMALSGLKPVCEIQFEGFVYPAMNQIVTQAARMRDRWNGTLDLHLVIRVPVGGGIRAVEHHSESNEALFAHTPGLLVACPSSGPDASAMLGYAVAAGSPVIFYEPKRLYWQRRLQDRGRQNGAGPTGARVVRPGTDITVAGYGAVLEDVLAAAQSLSATIDVEVIDLRWIAPLDVDAVLASVARTGRLLAVHEAVEFCGVGAELVAAVVERGWHLLTAPPRRLAAPRRNYPPADTEGDYLVGQADITAAIQEMCR